jgi:hypothetical protein
VILVGLVATILGASGFGPAIRPPAELAAMQRQATL